MDLVERAALFARAAHGGDAECQPRAQRRRTEVLLQVRVKLDQPRHHSLGGRIHNRRV